MRYWAGSASAREERTARYEARSAAWTPAGRPPDALDPGFHGVGTPWIRGFMAFWLARCHSGSKRGPWGAGGGQTRPRGPTGRVGAGPVAGSPRDETRTFTLTGPQPPSEPQSHLKTPAGSRMVAYGDHVSVMS